MFGNYLKTSWRNLLKGRIYSVINLLGLSIGTAVVILLTLYVHDEWTFDRFHAKSDRIYRAWVKEHVQDQVFFNTVTPYILGESLRGNFPEIEHIVRFSNINTQIRKGNFTELEDLLVVESSLFDVFDFILIAGREEDVFTGLHNALITEEISRKYFGDPSAIGQTLTMQIGGSWTDFTVAGIMEKAPGNSSIQYDIIIPFENTKSYMSEGGRTSWTNVNVETFVLLSEQSHVKDVESKIAPFINAKVADIYQPGEYIVGLQPLTDIHLNREYPDGFLAVSDKRYPYILSGVAILILLLACINFTSLAIGRSISRAREVGVRKATGASRSQIMFQFWSEALVTSGVSILLGLGIAKTLLVPFNEMAGKQLSLSLNLLTIVSLAGLVVLTGLLAGMYPSFVLSGFSPVRTLRGAITKLGSDKHVLLRGLVGFQFLLSILLIICTIVMTKQLHFIQQKNLGFEKEQLIVLPYIRSGVRLGELLHEAKAILERLRPALQRDARFSNVAMASHTVGTPGWMRLGYTETTTEKFRQFYICAADAHLIPTLRLQMAEGRSFSDNAVAENNSVIVNETYAREFNVKAGDALQEPFQAYSVIGIVKDFNFESLHSTVQPLVMAIEPVPLVRAASDLNFGDYPNPKFLIRLRTDDIAGIIAQLRQVWLEVAPEQPFTYSFVDDNIQRQYDAEIRLSNVIGIATVLAIFIACMGLFGIATLTVSQRVKEIGVRKVLGASTVQLTRLLSGDFIRLVVIALVPASLIGWYFMNSWLQDFAFRIHIDWWVFILAGVISISIALMTVSLQSMRAASKSPVESLRNE
jgi:putative ABC transport system permease protein